MRDREGGREEPSAWFPHTSLGSALPPQCSGSPHLHPPPRCRTSHIFDLLCTKVSIFLT